MKKKRILSFLTLVALLFSFLFSGCFDSNAAKNSAEIYCSLIFKSDAQNIQQIGLSDSDKDNLIKDYQSKIKDRLKQNLIFMGYLASDDQLNSVCDGYKEALSKITYETKQISKSGDEAQVEISTTNFDVKKIDEQAATDALNETDTMEFSSTDEENNKFNEIYLNKLAEGLKNAEISSDKSSNTFKFKKVNKYWVPDDSANFGYKLIRLATDEENTDLNIDEESISPEESAKLFWNLVINQDSSSIEKIGYSKAFGERLIKNKNKEYFKYLKNEFNKAGISLSDEQIQGIINALLSSIKKTSANFEVASKTDNLAKVKVSSTSINLNSIATKTENNIKNQISSGKITSKQQALDSCISLITDEINNAQLGSSNNENTFSFTKIADIWIPSNVNNYVENITDMSIK
ncbi:DUF5105 domain-containing protein [Clostridium saccharobutylicum]|uniref:DUF5105 domain-containing protein n=1 Tax=Clostridium saccharobutylicum DSM 13864 TaxID=1345695 RepID=U5MMU9_CLOSA|nr:DUF5105 domain-containing protein [Clostridium saccharobutylicum]AGX41858.1 hypothetical protein CLSA_c08450 [Clostridium saccharobutylicum DSM 13864]AQR89132.1 hypothetical protein CLOSC_08280 [Clostridium saccharobutylicum]AQR99033.1 hypothetical protein CSACC_08350 [Clostridium saccharobutylicum]AQS13021.1 hypothetical protein CLOSACC_08350 [Clostridium saccharobutylicum]MBA2903858.1 hypothetical protein [Clostridium saccharobutylicum]